MILLGLLRPIGFYIQAITLLLFDLFWPGSSISMIATSTELTKIILRLLKILQ